MLYFFFHMELWEINMNHVSKIVIFFHIYTCIYEYLIIIIDIYFIEDKKNRKCYWRCTNVQCILCWLNDCPLLSREYLESRKKEKDSVYARFYLRLFALIRRYQWNSTFWNAHLTVNVFFFVILNIAHDAFLSIVIPLFCVQNQ